MDKKPMTAGEIAGRLAAKKIEPLVDYVERVTGTKLRLEAPEQTRASSNRREPNGKFPEPNGKCWCGCGEQTHSYFAPGHDSKAKSKLLRKLYGEDQPIARFLWEHGYGPERRI